MLQAIWDETRAPSEAADARAFTLAVMEKIAARRLAIDLAARFAIIVALLACGWALAPALGALTTAFAIGGAAGLFNAVVIALLAALVIAAAARRWSGRRLGV